MIFQQDGEEIKFSSFKGDFEREKRGGAGVCPLSAFTASVTAESSKCQDAYKLASRHPGRH